MNGGSRVTHCQLPQAVFNEPKIIRDLVLNRFDIKETEVVYYHEVHN